MSQNNLEGMWTFPSLEDAIPEAGVKKVDTYVAHHQKTIEQFIATRPIIDLFLGAAWIPGAWALKRWW